MRRYNTVMTVPVASLEPGDLFAYEFLGHINTAQVIKLAYYRTDLSDEMVAYMREHDLDIPDNDWTPLAGMQVLVFKTYSVFMGKMRNEGGLDHSFMDRHQNVAVFPHVR